VIDRETHKVKHVKFEPWKGDRYHEAPFGKRVLILGESHYDWDSNNLIADDRNVTKDRVEEQIDEDRHILAQHPQWNDVRVRLAGMLRLLDQMDESVELLRRAILSDTAGGDAWFALGLTFVDSDSLDRAILAFQSGLVLDGKRTEAEYRIGLMYCGELEFDLAMEAAGELDEDMQRQVWVVLDAMGLCDPSESLPIASPVAAEANARV